MRAFEPARRSSGATRRVGGTHVVSLGLCAVVVSALSGCASDPSAVGLQAAAIVDGQRDLAAPLDGTFHDTVRQWHRDATVQIQPGFCSGVLVAPNVVLTAAHCVRTQPTGVTFGIRADAPDPANPDALVPAPDDTPPGFTAGVIACITHPRSGITCGDAFPRSRLCRTTWRSSSSINAWITVSSGREPRRTTRSPRRSYPPILRALPRSVYAATSAGRGLRCFTREHAHERAHRLPLLPVPAAGLARGQPGRAAPVRAGTRDRWAERRVRRQQSRRVRLDSGAQALALDLRYEVGCGPRSRGGSGHRG